MPKTDTDEVAKLRDQVAALEGRVDALGLALQASIISADDALRHHREGIIRMLDGLRLEHCPPGARAALSGFINSLDRIGEPEAETAETV